MAYFVKPSKASKEPAQDLGDRRQSIMIIASAKKMGLSFMELNELTMQDLVDLTDEWTGNTETTREATTEDIDAFYGM